MAITHRWSLFILGSIVQSLCLLNNLKPIKIREPIIGFLVGHDPKMTPIDIGVSRSKVKITVIGSIKSLFAQ